MQAFISMITAFFMSIGSFFAYLPHVIYPWDKPSSTITAADEVLKIYRDIAQKNTNTQFTKNMKITEYPNIAGLETSKITGLVNTALALTNVDQIGLPGAPGNLRTSDLQSAKAEYYHSGKTLVITLIPKEQTDGFNGQAAAGPVGRSIGVLGENVQGMLSVFTGFGIPLNTMSGVVQVKYQSPSVSITADAKSGKILKAELKYHLVIELPVPLISTPRVAADYSVIKKAY